MLTSLWVRKWSAVRRQTAEDTHVVVVAAVGEERSEIGAPVMQVDQVGYRPCMGQTQLSNSPQDPKFQKR